jgi:hypothetical protein
MARKRRVAKTRRELTEPEAAWLHSRLLPDGSRPIDIELLGCEGDRRQLWQAHGDDVVAEWIADNPGTRPAKWWKYTAEHMRERVGGVGSPAHEALAYVPYYVYGIPAIWLLTSGVGYFNGQSLDWRQGATGAIDPNAVPVDPRDPPRFEAEATYLKRHGLLLPGEAKRLTAEDFEPESLPMESDHD